MFERYERMQGLDRDVNSQGKLIELRVYKGKTQICLY
jgi:hypothetical protein